MLVSGFWNNKYNFIETFHIENISDISFGKLLKFSYPGCGNVNNI